MVDNRAHALRIVLQLSERDEGVTVRVLEAPFGQGLSAGVVLQRIDDVLRMVSQPTFHEDVGRGLFRALFPGELQDVYRAALAETTVKGIPLPVELRFDHDVIRMARYPWELLHDGSRFPVQSGNVRLMRGVPYPDPLPDHHRQTPLEVLFVAAHPSDQSALVPQYQALADALGDPIRAGTLDLAYLLPPTWDALADWLLAGAPHMLHFEGHATLARWGRLAFEGQRGSDWVEVGTLGAMFYGTGLHAVVLGAAEASPAPGDGLPAGVGPSLVLSGVPAVVALQGTLPADAAAGFFAALYDAVLQGQPLDEAVETARRALRRTVYWYLPALFVRAPALVSPSGGSLPARIDTAAPREVSRGYPVRVALWVSEAAAPLPPRDCAERLVGAVWSPDPSAPLVAETLAARVTHDLVHGAVEVRLSAPGCEIHSPDSQSLIIAPGLAAPPVWFALTARQEGPVALRFEVWQGGALAAEVTHAIDVTRAEQPSAVLALRSHYWNGQRPPGDTPPDPAPAIDAPLSAGPEASPEAPPDVAPEDEQSVDDALDDMLGWLQSSDPTDEGAARAESAAPAPPRRLARPPVTPPRKHTRRIFGLPSREFALVFAVLLLAWLAVALLVLQAA